MPTMGNLHSLKVVEIDGRPNLKCIGSEFYGQNHDGASSSGAVFPVLRELTLKNMPKLAEWLEEKSLPPSGMVFPCIEKLKIAKCPQLITAPGFAYFAPLQNCNIWSTVISLLKFPLLRILCITEYCTF
ncbi:hypothetical protein F0562_001670 [Nyssa sinensis]|uniref:NB-ARC domain-containing protein n=1 Tax=Nyssa sinensis TaxID=561372 RepID=A0A5J5C3L0_9ASTE|nr:hypothetical protein F0562_001670 [Nyssa sinensis]